MASVKPSFRGAVVERIVTRKKRYSIVLSVFRGDAYSAQEHRPEKLLTGPIRLDLVFHVARPKGHFGSGRNAGYVRSSAPARPTTKPDVLKLARGVEDALTNVIWVDDAQIVDENLRKVYSDTPGVEISVVPL